MNLNRLTLTIALLLVAAAATAGPLEERLRSFVSERAQVDRADVILPSLADFALPAEGPVEVRLSANPEEDYAGSTPVTVSLVSAGRELKRGSVSVRVRREGSVLVASRALPAGSRIEPGDVLERRAEGRVAAAIATASRIVGRQTKRSVAAGTPWSESLVVDAPLVTRGELVKIQLVVGGLRIDGTARARQDGVAGERVSVLNVTSRRELVGTVGADGVVHVDP